MALRSDTCSCSVKPGVCYFICDGYLIADLILTNSLDNRISFFQDNNWAPHNCFQRNRNYILVYFYLICIPRIAWHIELFVLLQFKWDLKKQTDMYCFQNRADMICLHAMLIQIAGIKMFHYYSISAFSNGRYLEDGGTDGINQGKKHHSDTNR